MSEPISLSKFFGSFFSKIYWVKVIALGIGLFFIFGVGYTGYQAVIKPTQEAESIVNHYYQPKLGGCMTIRGEKK